MNTKIFIMTHKRIDPPGLFGYVPMLVGSAFHDDDFGYLRDDTGDNISRKNKNYSELTGLYWLWKNEKECDALGLCHYRRFFAGKKDEILTTDEAERLLSQSDLIVPRLVKSAVSVRKQYVEKHHEEDLFALEMALKKEKPEYLKAYKEVMEGNSIYPCNMFIAKRDVFFDYCSFLFPVLFEAERRLDISSYDEYAARVYGFLSERLLLVFIKKEGLKPYELSEGVNSEKAETVDLIERMSEKIKENDLQGAKALSDDTMDKRPDAFFLEADTNGRLAALTRAVEIRLLEEKYGITESIFKSVDPQMLIERAKDMKELVKAAARGKGDVQRLSKEDISFISVKVFLDIDPDISSNEKMSLLAALAEDAAKRGDMQRAGLFANAAIASKTQV
ncbi:MAG: DUF4422 domain-containing protein [Lachnospiraceae bacterium]|nr:DUF4422 domain-containing protein [Lachnospiraceae bacterium]